MPDGRHPRPGRACPTRAGLLLLAVTGLLLAAAALAPVAGAHGGAKVGETTAGPYRVELYAATVKEDDALQVDYTAYLRRVATGFPVDDATVRIAVVRKDGSTFGPEDARGFTNGYDVLVPAGTVAEIDGQRVTVTVVDGPEGAAEGEVVVRSSSLPAGSSGPGSGGGSGGVLWIAIGAAVAVLLAAFVWISVRGDRDRRPAAAGEDQV